MANRFFIVLIVLFNCCFASSSLASEPPEKPEKFEYDLTWYGLKAGTSTMEVKDDGQGGGMYVSKTRSADWVTVFYPVEDRIESRHRGPFPDKYHLRLREGTRQKDREVTFLRPEGKAIYKDNLEGKKKAYDIPKDAQDPLSAFFLARRLDLQVGKSVFVPIFDSKRMWDVEIKVLRKERVTVPAGTFDAIVIKPLMKSEGIFDSKGDIFIWLSDDERRIPVMVKSKVKIGSVLAELTGGKY
jgi:hypothetical protein